MDVRWIGVCPRRDQVRLSGETSEKPLSSSSARVAPSWRHFFYPRQFFFLPLLDGRFITVQWLALRSLVAPTHPLHHMPDGAGLMPNTKQLPDHLSDPIQCPIIARISKGICSFVQRFLQTFQLLGRQLPRATRRTTGFLLPGLFRFCLPAIHGTLRDFQNFSHLFRRLPLR